MHPDPMKSFIAIWINKISISNYSVTTESDAWKY